MNSRLYFTVSLVVLVWLPETTTATMTNATMTNATVAPTLEYNNTVTLLETPLSNAGCGSERLCAAEPANCNPASGSCTLLGAKQKSGNNFEFILAGESSGYLAAVLVFGSTLGEGDTAYVCFNQNGNIAFTGGILNNDVLTKQNVSANNVKGKLNGTKIECTFDATVVRPTGARVSGVSLGVISGTYNSSSGFGRASTTIKTNPVNLASPNDTVTNTANVATTASPNVTTMTTTASPNVTTMTTTASPNVTTMTTTNTTSNAMSFRQTLIQVLMISAGMVGLTML